MESPSAPRKKFDVLVIGGGINGAGIARDLAGRKLSVLLCEKSDLASATSSASTKLIHGGLRYLEYGAFGLVRAALHERTVLMKAAPHIIRPLTFILPHHAGLRPRWLLQLGLFLYDHLGGPSPLSPSQSLDLHGGPLQDRFTTGFSYTDGWVDDSRLVILNALDAEEKGAQILTRVACVGLTPQKEHALWQASLRDALSGRVAEINARFVVNAAGPWVQDVLKSAEGARSRHGLRHVKGSHIVVPRLYDGAQAYILQNDDRRIVFIIPYEEKYSLIGTTDIDYTGGDLQTITISPEEIEYLCTAASRFLRRAVSPQDVRWSYSGVRALLDDGKSQAAAVTRDYLLDLQKVEGAPLLSVYGGKITTFRKLSEQVAEKVVAELGHSGPAWTAYAPLPGAEGLIDYTAFLKGLQAEYAWMPDRMIQRLARSYGTRIRHVLRGIRRIEDLGEQVAEGLYAAEVCYLADKEWAMTGEDILWRRSRLGLHVPENTDKKIDRLLRQRERKKTNAL